MGSVLPFPNRRKHAYKAWKEAQAECRKVVNSTDDPEKRREAWERRTKALDAYLATLKH